MSVRKQKSSGGRFNFEALEDRRLMAADVQAQLINNTLFIKEANNAVNGANQVAVSQLANGKIRVAGITLNGDPSKINGQAFVDFTIPGGASNTNLVVNLGGGNDRLMILPGTHLDSAAINMSVPGAGVNDVDMVDIQGLTTRNGVQIDTGDGVDNVFIQNSHLGDGVGTENVTIRTGAGADYVQVGNTSSWSDIRGNLDIRTYASTAEHEADTVKVQLVTGYHNITADTGGGDDKVEMLATTAGDDIVIVTGDDKDTVTLREVRAVDQLFALLGAGDDRLDMTHVNANSFFADGGGGTDRFSHSIPGTFWTSKLQGFEYVNGRYVFTSVGTVNGTQVAAKV